MTPDTTKSRALSRSLAERLFCRLDKEQFPLHRVSTGSWLRRAGERHDSLPYIENGFLEAVLFVGDQGAQVIPVTFGPGELALLSTLFSSEPVRGDIIAGEALELRWLPVAQIEAELLRDQELLILLVRFLAQRLHDVRTRERGWLARDLHGRVCAALTRVAEESLPSPGMPWIIPLTHEKLALRCGVSRPKLSQELKHLERVGVVKLSRGAIEVLDIHSLFLDA